MACLIVHRLSFCLFAVRFTTGLSRPRSYPNVHMYQRHSVYTLFSGLPLLLFLGISLLFSLGGATDSLKGVFPKHVPPLRTHTYIQASWRGVPSLLNGCAAIYIAGESQYVFFLLVVRLVWYVSPVLSSRMTQTTPPPNYLLCGQCRSQLLQKWPSTPNMPPESVARIPNYTLTPYIHLNSSKSTTIRLIQCSSCLETVGYTYSQYTITPPASPDSSTSSIGFVTPDQGTNEKVDPLSLEAYVNELESLEMEIALRRIPMKVHRLEGICCWYGERVICDDQL